jgi:hypothetical protein
MLVAGAAIVFAAPIASAETIKPHHASVKHQQATTAKKAAKVTSKTKVTTPRPPLYTYIPGYSGPPLSSMPDQGYCETYLVNCTDQQLCQMWGENCTTAGPGQTSSDDVSTPPADPPVSTSVSTSDTAQAGSGPPAAADDPGLTSDTSAVSADASTD